MKKTIIILISAILFIGCNNEPEDPHKNTGADNQAGELTPTAGFNYSPTTPRYPDAITFTNTSINADSYEWDFGNNKTSTQKNGTASYEPGTWTVRLTAYSKNKTKKDVITKTVNVKKDYSKFKITKITVNKISFITSSGAGWDSTSGPDIYFDFVKSNSIVYKTGRVSDVKLSDIPFSISADYTAINSDFTWTIRMFDWDGIDILDGDDLMTTFTLNFSDIKRKSNVVLTSGDFQITLSIEWIE